MLSKVPTPPGPCNSEVKGWELDRRREDEGGNVRLGRLMLRLALGDTATFGVDAGDEAVREKSKDVFGVLVARSDKGFDFRRVRAKKPRWWRGSRAISTGVEKSGRRTQESCFQGGSSAFEKLTEDAGLCNSVDDGSWEDLEDQSFGAVDENDVVELSCMLSASVSSPSKSSSFPCAAFGAAHSLPLTPHASTGSTIVFRAWIVSFGHIRFAFLITDASQLYFNATPAIVSAACT